MVQKHEYEADRFAVNAVDKKENMKSALLKLGNENLFQSYTASAVQFLSLFASCTYGKT